MIATTADKVVQMPKKRQQTPKTKLAYLSADQLERVLRAAKEHGPREHCMFCSGWRTVHGQAKSQISVSRTSI